MLHAAAIQPISFLMMTVPESLLAELRDIDTWTTAPLPSLETNDDFMTIAMELMNHAQHLLLIGVSLAESDLQAEQGVRKRKSIVLGHLVRIHKLYDVLRYHTVQRHRDICMIFQRLLIETIIRAEYLMGAKRASFRSFVLASYRPEKEIIDDLMQKAKTRPLQPIERRMLASIKRSLKDDRIPLKELRANRRWDLDGKNFRQILSEIRRDPRYAYGFGIGSHFVHGDWFDLKMHHLERVNGRYKAEWHHGVPDPRLVCAPTILCLNCLMHYVKWSRCDRDRFFLPTVTKILDASHRLDRAHETSLQRASSK